MSSLPPASRQTRSRGTALVIGNFDGVHLGHRALLEAMMQAAVEDNLAPVVLTFDPHPAVVLGTRVVEPLCTTERRVALLRQWAPTAEVVVETFTREFASMAPERFIEDLLVGRYGVRAVVVGSNFRFGVDRRGSGETLRRLGSRFGFRLAEGRLVEKGGEPVSSSRVRTAVRAGELEAAAELLGRLHSFSGVIVQGFQRGRLIGFPTANFHEVTELLPPRGVYAGWVTAERGPLPASPVAALLNIGVRPTVEAGASVEAHLLDFSGDLYGAKLRFHLACRLRDEVRFDGLEALKAQLQLDEADGRRRLAAFRPPSSSLVAR